MSGPDISSRYRRSRPEFGRDVAVTIAIEGTPIMTTNGDPPNETTRTALTEIAVAHRYRRRLLYCLFTYANPMRLPDVAHQLTIWEHHEVDTGERLEIYNALYHDHLPPLREADLVTYHQRDDEVELGPRAGRIRRAIGDRLRVEIDDLTRIGRNAIDSRE